MNRYIPFSERLREGKLLHPNSLICPVLTHEDVLFEMVLRPDKYTEAIRQKLIDNKEAIIKAAQTKHLNILCNRLTAILYDNKINFQLGIGLPRAAEFKKYGINGGVIDLDEYHNIHVELNERALDMANNNTDTFISYLVNTIGHELVHRSQWLTSKKNMYVNYGPEDIEKYISSKYELMALAWQIVELNRMSGKSDKTSLSSLRFGKVNPLYYSFEEALNTLTIPNKDKIFNQLNKYIYQYLGE